VISSIPSKERRRIPSPPHFVIDRNVLTAKVGGSLSEVMKDSSSQVRNVPHCRSHPRARPLTSEKSLTLRLGSSSRSTESRPHSTAPSRHSRSIGVISGSPPEFWEEVGATRRLDRNSRPCSPPESAKPCLPTA